MANHNANRSYLFYINLTLPGTTPGGGLGFGAVIKLNKEGSGLKRIYSFKSKPDDGRNPKAALIQGSDGALYGTTPNGGIYDRGTVFKLNRDGTGYAVLYHCPDNTWDDAGPQAPLIEGSDKALYGTRQGSGYGDKGEVFRMNKDGSGYMTLHYFKDSSNNDGAYPETAVIEGKDGVLYGTTFAGGRKGRTGTVFKINKDGTGYAILWDFNGDAMLNPTGASWPNALLQGSDGALYGTSPSGGANGGWSTGDLGLIYKLNTDGTGYQEIWNFLGASGGDGISPGEMIQGADGALYGLTFVFTGPSIGCGTLFRLNMNGMSYSMLHKFWDGQIGIEPGNFFEGSDGFLYGTTEPGHNYATPPGTLFRVNKDGSAYTVLYSFTNLNASGTRLFEASNGTLYGTTVYYGNTNRVVLFTLNKDGSGSK